MKGDWEEAGRLVDQALASRADMARVADPEVERVRYEVENRRMVTELREVRGVCGWGALDAVPRLWCCCVKTRECRSPTASPMWL